jgi:hypothetical protein
LASPQPSFDSNVSEMARLWRAFSCVMRYSKPILGKSISLKKLEVFQRRSPAALENSTTQKWYKNAGPFRRDSTHEGQLRQQRLGESF